VAYASLSFDRGCIQFQTRALPAGAKGQEVHAASPRDSHGQHVDFPNLDPFFHNVFSLFNGKRFDLGLYESGSTRTVHFDHDGVSYIFCNIHPEMSAVIVTLSTPYFEVSPADGSITLHAVPPGTYEMHVWAEGSSAQDLNALSRRVAVTASQKDLGVIDVTVDSARACAQEQIWRRLRGPQGLLVLRGCQFSVKRGEEGSVAYMGRKQRKTDQFIPSTLGKV
jgi:hypothetical protein